MDLEFVIDLLSGGGGTLGAIGFIANAILRSKDKKHTEKALEEQKKEIEEEGYKRDLRKDLIMSRIKGALHSFEKKLTREYGYIAKNYNYPMEVNKGNYSNDLSYNFAKSDFEKALIVANKVCRDEIKKEIIDYLEIDNHYDVQDGIVRLTHVIHEMYKDVVLDNAGYCILFEEVCNRLTKEDVHQNIKVLYSYAVNNITLDIDGMYNKESNCEDTSEN